MKLYLSIISTDTGDKLTMSKAESCVTSKCWMMKAGKREVRRCYCISEFALDCEIGRTSPHSPHNRVKYPALDMFMNTVINIALGKMFDTLTGGKIYYDELSYNKFCHIEFRADDVNATFERLLQNINQLYFAIAGFAPDLYNVCADCRIINVTADDSARLTNWNGNINIGTIDNVCANSHEQITSANICSQTKTADIPTQPEENAHVLIEKLRTAVLRIENELNEKTNTAADYKKDAEKFREMRAMFSSP